MIERRVRDFEARARNRRETAELWAVRTPGGVESGAPGVRHKKNHDRGCAMSDEFDNRDANEKVALESTLYRCRALVGRIGEELRKKKPEHFVDERSLADFHASLEHAASVLEQTIHTPTSIAKGLSASPLIESTSRAEAARSR